MLVLKINLYSNVQSLTNQDWIHDIVINFVSACPVLVFLVCTDPKMLIEACRSLSLFLEAVTVLDRMVTFFILNFWKSTKGSWKSKILSSWKFSSMCFQRAFSSWNRYDTWHKPMWRVCFPVVLSTRYNFLSYKKILCSLTTSFNIYLSIRTLRVEMAKTH